MLLQAATPPPAAFTRTDSVANRVTFDWGSVAAYGRFAVLSSLLGFLFSVLITCALAQAISTRYLGRRLGVLETFRDVGAGGFLRLAGALILAIVVGILALTVLAIAGFALSLVSIPLAILFGVGAGIAVLVGATYLSVSFLFLPQAVVLERSSILRAFRRSWTLVRGSWWRVLGIWLLLSILVGVVNTVAVQVVLLAVVIGHQDSGSLSYQLVNRGLSGIVSTLVQPVQLGALTLLYYDLRIRKEGFDLDYMAQMIDQAADAP
jgi:hypothetical protein